MPRGPIAAALLLLAATPAPAAAAKGADLCVLFVSEAFRGFHFGRVDFDAKRVVDLLPLPAALTGAGGGCAAGADDGQFFIPNPNVAYNSLIELNVIKNTTVTRTVAPPPAYAGTVPAFYTMQLNDATGDVYALFEESRSIAWVAAATVYPGNGTSVAISADFASQWLGDFQWRKVGVSAVDSKRGLLYFVAGVGAQGAETLVGVPVGDPAAPVVFVEKAGPGGASSDIDFLGYSAPLDLFVASCFSINTGIASVKTMPAGAAGGAAAWTDIYTWTVGAENDMELGNGALSADGRTFWVALDDGKEEPSYFAFDLTSGKLVSTFAVPATQWPGMITAEVVAC
jgi:hypothetical protein